MVAAAMAPVAGRAFGIRRMTMSAGTTVVVGREVGHAGRDTGRGARLTATGLVGRDVVGGRRIVAVFLMAVRLGIVVIGVRSRVRLGTILVSERRTFVVWGNCGWE